MHASILLPTNAFTTLTIRNYSYFNYTLPSRRTTTGSGVCRREATRKFVRPVVVASPSRTFRRRPSCARLSLPPGFPSLPALPPFRSFLPLPCATRAPVNAVVGEAYLAGRPPGTAGVLSPALATLLPFAGGRAGDDPWDEASPPTFLLAFNIPHTPVPSNSSI